MPNTLFTGKGTFEDIAEQVAHIELDLDIPERPRIDPLVDPLPSLADGEGLDPEISRLERLGLGIQTSGATYNKVTGLLSKPEDPVVDPNFRIADHLDEFEGMTEDDYDHLLEAVSLQDLQARKEQIRLEREQVASLMEGGVVSGMGYMLLGMAADPIFIAGVLAEGGTGVLGVVSKSARIAQRSRRAIKLSKADRAYRAGAYAGATAGIETAILASERATIDSEDVLYATAGGLVLGTAMSRAFSRFQHTGDDFVRSADSAADQLGRDVQRTLDDQLVAGTRHPKVREEGSIFGKFDPDEAAAVRAERSAEDIAIAGVDDVADEAKGYADAFWRNIESIKSNGGLQIQKVKNSRTFKVLEKNPLMSDFIRLFRSKSEGVNYLAMELLEDASGVTGRRATAAITAHRDTRKLLEQTMKPIRNSFLQYAKENNIPWASRTFTGKGRDGFFRLMREELEHYRNASVRGVEYKSQAPVYVQNAVNAWRKSMKEAADLSRSSGVRGMQDIRVHDGYVPLLWAGQKMAALGGTARKGYQDLLTTAYTQAGIDAKSAGIIAGAVFNRKVKQAIGLDTNPGALLSRDSREFLKEMLDLNNVTKAEQDALFGRIDGTLAERGKAARAKGRTPVDLTVTDSQGRSLIDLVNNDLYTVGSRYITEMAGRSALARKGIRHDGAWRAIRNAAAQDAQRHGEDAVRVSETLDGIYQQFLGRPVGEGIHKGGRRMLEWSMTSMLGTVGLAQAAESGNIIAAYGIANLMKYAPDVRKFRNSVKKGTADDSLLNELNVHYGGMWDEHLFLRPEVRLDQAGGTSSAMWGALDNVLAGSKEMLGYMSGMNHIRRLQQQFVAIGQVNRVVSMLKDGTQNTKLLSRFADAGWDERTLRSIKSKIDDGTVTFQKNGAVDKLNLEMWDARTYEQFALGMHRHSNQLIQFPLIGETANWQHKTLGAMLSQFRTFPMLAAEKQAARGIRIGDPEALLAFQYGLGLSALLYTGRVHALSSGRPDREEFMERRLAPGALVNGALQWAPMFSLTSEVVNAATAGGLLPADWGTGGVGRSGGGGGSPAFSFDRQVPAISVLRSGMQVGTGLLTSISPFNENTWGNAETDNVFRAAPLGNIAPMQLLKNQLHNIPEED